ncbi:uncharacterized protein LOC141590323 [Silene latifolia]|uniref:uncharacterized protein LOC141590323 n=1 Tax=Silene latifolia TaxID=37657 RepID=UPI003D76E9F0
MKPATVTDKQLKLRAFPFSLKDAARDWLYYIPPGSIDTWVKMKKAFLEKYFPASRASQLKKEISNAEQKDGETMYEYWERFKKLRATCPYHGYTAEDLVMYFCGGLSVEDARTVHAACRGVGASSSSHLEEKVDTLTTLFKEMMMGQKMAMLPPKCSDPGMFAIPCTIGDLRFEKAMLDLGASINVIPYAIYEKLKFGLLKDTSVVIQLADRSSVYPKEVVENVMVVVGKLVFPADFYVLDMKSESDAIPVFLGRPFLKTAGTKIDVSKGSLTMEFDGTGSPPKDQRCVILWDRREDAEVSRAHHMVKEINHEQPVIILLSKEIRKEENTDVPA